MKNSLAALTIVALLGGCPTTITCPAGTRFVGGICLTDDGGVPIDAPPDEDVPEGTDAGPCNGECTTAAAPVCDVDTNECVECTDALTHCSAPNLACIDGACEECETNAECTTAEFSVCNTTTHECEACENATGCGHDGLGAICDTSGGDGVCVECTVATEPTDCDLNSCDPATRECTTTPRTSVRRCGACVADSECMNVDDRCVPMQFDGTDHGSYCLKQFDTSCMNPFRTTTPARISMSGAPAETYCGVDENVTTCEAVLDLTTDQDCTMDEDCGATGLDDGRCETVLGSANKCTYSCGASFECPASATCGTAGNYCGSP